jgi:hypothetical protein
MLQLFLEIKTGRENQRKTESTHIVDMFSMPFTFSKTNKMDVLETIYHA